jgi:SAM-dependent methyltransferase
MPRPDAKRPAPDTTPSVVVDPEWGYRRLDPLPAPEALARFYESRYRDLLDAGGRAPDLARLMGTGPEADRERAWLAATLHADVVDAIAPVAAAGGPRRSLDIGCGTGDLVSALVAAGWDATGVEPATEIARVGQARALRIEAASAAEFLSRWRADGGTPFGAITLVNVLEHVPEPATLLTDLIDALAPGGRLVARVPNDFSPLQAAAQHANGREPWWIVSPDHLNYFDHASIAALLERLGLDVVDQSADFPMELFILMGDDYVGDPTVGGAVHERRRKLDMALDADVRRRLGRAWAAAGMGRNAFVVAQRPGS